MPANERKLRVVLKANAIFSFTSGVLVSLFYGRLADFMQVGNAYVLLGIGIGLILFSATVFQAARRGALSPRQVKSIIIQDWAWVLGSVMIIGLQAWDLTNAAYWMVGVVALIVADFAIFQRKYLKGL